MMLNQGDQNGSSMFLISKPAVYGIKKYMVFKNILGVPFKVSSILKHLQITLILNFSMFTLPLNLFHNENLNQ